MICAAVGRKAWSLKGRCSRIFETANFPSPLEDLEEAYAAPQPAAPPRPGADPGFEHRKRLIQRVVVESLAASKALVHDDAKGPYIKGRFQSEG
jgi:hypothetical protein